MKTWDQICLAVEKIIDGKTFTDQIKYGKHTIPRQRPMRFREFCGEIGFGYQEAYQAIRGPLNPSPELEKATREWVAKNNRK